MIFKYSHLQLLNTEGGIFFITKIMQLAFKRQKKQGVLRPTAF